MGNIGDWLTITAVLWGILAGFAAYAKALAEAKAGRLVVYCDWGDFLKSSAWIVFLPIGIAWLADESAESIWRIAGCLSIGAAVCSVWMAIAGAFRHNTSGNVWLALFARIAVTLLVLFALAKLKERFEDYQRNKFGSGVEAAIRGVVIPLALFGVVFNWLIRPMIGNHSHTGRIRENVKRQLNIKGVVMNVKRRVMEFFQCLKDKLPVSGRATAEENYSSGLQYYKGSSVKRDRRLALACFQHAANRGLADAQYRVGMIYDSGDGVMTNKYLAFKWYMKAAEQGHAKAQMCIGYAYRNGEGCEEDVKKAFAWYSKAAEQGEATAQNNLAVMYECGVGVAKDTVMARHWYKKSIENGHAAASDNLKDMEKKLLQENQCNNGAKEKKVAPIDVLVSSGAACDVDLKSLVGLDPVKKAVSELRNFIAYKIECGKRGLPSAQVSNHCVFTGNPGTGKTTVARIIAKLYHEMGLLKTAKVLEVDRSRVVGEYIGHTAKQMSKVIDEAMDGVLFIDEAYSLSEGGEKDFGREAVEVLLKRMDDNRDRLVVIVAGYTDEMHKFIDMNPGLKSRFTHYIEFPDYSADELERIFLSMCGKDGYICDDIVRKTVRAKMEAAIEKRDRSFGNARFVRNFYEEAQRRIASRLANKLSTLSDAELKTFVASDFS